jgi:DNA-binding response OmpR family regulator
MANILVVEDEEPLRKAMAEKLTRAEHKVIQAEDGEAGLKAALEGHPDIILLDIVMPKMDGQEMLSRLRQDPWGAKVPVIFLTNLSDPDEVYKAMKERASDFLVKSDLKLVDLVQIVEQRLKTPSY